MPHQSNKKYYSDELNDYRKFSSEDIPRNDRYYYYYSSKNPQKEKKLNNIKFFKKLEEARLYKKNCDDASKKAQNLKNEIEILGSEIPSNVYISPREASEIDRELNEMLASFKELTAKAKVEYESYKVAVAELEILREKDEKYDDDASDIKAQKNTRGNRIRNSI
jgi:hypothetical protein